MTLVRKTEQTSAIVASRKVKPDPLTQADYEAIKAELGTVRDQLLVKIMRGTGLRVGEVLALTAGALFENGPIRGVYVLRGKKRGEPVYERVFLQPELAVGLFDYVKGQGTRQDARIFPLTDRRVRDITYQAGERAIGRRVRPHEFRALYIKTLIDGGLPVEAAAKMVGHTDTRTTLKHYYELTGPERAEITRRIPV